MSTSRMESREINGGRAGAVADEPGTAPPGPSGARPASLGFPEGAGPSSPWVFFGRRQFLFKTILLAVTTVALIPILLLKDTQLGIAYLVGLAAVHVAGLAVIAVGVNRHQIAPDRRGLVIRLVGIAILVALLGLAAEGLGNDLSSMVFWGALFAIWALHTLGLALLHLRSRREQSVCPFV
jgi:hypothetical protein